MQDSAGNVQVAGGSLTTAVCQHEGATRPARSVDEPEGSREVFCICQQYGAMRFARDVHKPDVILECLYVCLAAHALWLVTLLPEPLIGETI